MACSAFSIKWHCSHLQLIPTHKTGFSCAERWRQWVFGSARGTETARLNGEASEDVNCRPWWQLPGPRSMPLFSRLYWGSDVFGFYVLLPLSPSSFSSTLCSYSLWFLACWRTPAVNLWSSMGRVAYWMENCFWCSLVGFYFSFSQVWYEVRLLQIKPCRCQWSESLLPFIYFCSLFDWTQFQCVPPSVPYLQQIYKNFVLPFLVSYLFFWSFGQCICNKI